MKYFNLILSLVIVALLIWVATLQRTIYVSQSKIARIEKKAITAKPVNEDLLLSLQDRDTTLILTCLGVGFGLFSFLTFKGVHDLFKFETLKVKEDYSKAENNYTAHEKKLKILEKDINYNTAQMMHERAMTHFRNNEIEKYALMYLSVMEKYGQILDSADDENDHFVEAIRNQLNTAIMHVDEALTIVESTAPILVERLSGERFSKKIEIISKHISIDNMPLLFRIASRFKIDESSE